MVVGVSPTFLTVTEFDISLSPTRILFLEKSSYRFPDTVKEFLFSSGFIVSWQSTSFPAIYNTPLRLKKLPGDTRRLPKLQMLLANGRMQITTRRQSAKTFFFNVEFWVKTGERALAKGFSIK